MKKAYLAFDLGAESGRAMLGVLNGGKLVLHELHRFANAPVVLPTGLHWNILGLWTHLLEGLRKAGQYTRENSIELAALGVDTWGVDYALLGKSGQLLGLPFAYRDARNIPAMEQAIACLGKERLYEVTGLQFMPFNTIFQLLAQNQSEPEMLRQAHRLAFLPDLLNYFFTGEMTCEATIASTSQAIGPRGSAVGRWATELLDELGIPSGMLGPIVPAGTRIGQLLPRLAAEAGLGQLNVIAPASHDTASAIAAVPATSGKDNWCYLSSGTWSLMGVELAEPLITPAGLAANFTNERGIGGTIRFLRNMPGMWLVQQTRSAFAERGQTYDYAALTSEAAAAQPFRTLFNPWDDSFYSAGRMLEKVTALTQATREPVPQDVGQFVRCCLESLALEYRRTLETLQSIIGRRLDVMHIVGGGGRNELLNQMAADATGKTVIAGPTEATAAGNALAQALGDGELTDRQDIRRIVAASFELKTFQPRKEAASTWDAAYERYQRIVGR